MEQQIKEILIKFEYLQKVIDTIQQNINLTWTILSVIVGVLAFTMFFLIKSIVNERVEKELTVIKNTLKIELKEEVKNDLKNELIKELKNKLENELKDYIKSHQQFKWATGTSPVNENNEVIISGLSISERSAKDLPVKLEVFTLNEYKKLDYDYQLSEGNLYLKLKNFNLLKDGVSIKWKLAWINDELYD